MIGADYVRMSYLATRDLLALPILANAPDRDAWTFAAPAAARGWSAAGLMYHRWARATEGGRKPRERLAIATNGRPNPGIRPRARNEWKTVTL
jgi:hypothetical protein